MFKFSLLSLCKHVVQVKYGLINERIDLDLVSQVILYYSISFIEFCSQDFLFSINFMEKLKYSLLVSLLS